MPDLDDWITRQSLAEYAGPKVFQRGLDYFQASSVTRLRDIGHRVSARVSGSEDYEVELWTDGEEFEYACTCPHAAEGNFCKHCVAAGLAFLDGRRGMEHLAPADTPQGVWKRLGEYLPLQPVETLVDWLLEAAGRDETTYRTLRLAMEKVGGSLHQIKALRREIDQIARYCNPDDWDSLLDSLEELLDTEPAAVVEVAEYAVERVEAAIPELEYDEGEAIDILDRLGELHRQACLSARPDPVALAERLFRYDTTGEGNAFHNSLPDYREALGEAGTRRYRELAEAAWRENPGRNYRISSIMENLARESGNIEALVAVKAHDLSSAHRFLDIAEIYQEARQPDQALKWAELGLEAFPERPDSRLRDFLAELYLELGRNDEALALAWAQFAEDPSLRTYQKLRDLAERLGRWPEQRERALAEVERAAQHPKRWATQNQTPDTSLRVEIALWEEDPEAGWEAAQRGYCQPGLKTRLAEKLEEPRPAEALALYLPMIPAQVAQGKNEAYQRAVELIGIVGELLQRLDREDEFQGLLAGWRAAFKAKRNFMKLLDEMGWDL
ncbi:Uncharacterized conserved protein, contains Zn finger domain [Methylomagnum ishizawai]|uniref:Uncharacterized conserved protein, contains Zn finger domain n=1 Tax=Methylomagnum ishizawai TaxID=1760988 RepID=A0A1Y6D4M8_9GAMM|nr:DUF6880 family protein [Methylomagnum ishizawai]SMF95334.1 Uncharacterized conserved protein, contains Zn finger domain [Methylomagnum ishizawai]